MAQILTHQIRLKKAAKSRCGDAAALICATTLRHSKNITASQVFSRARTTSNPRLNAPVCRAYSSELARLKGGFDLLKALQRVEPGITAHGFRSTFRDWVAERTNFPSEVAEMALAHAVGDKVEAAYRRDDLFEKRRQLAEAWAQYCDGEEPAESKVVRLAGRAG